MTADQLRRLEDLEAAAQGRTEDADAAGLRLQAIEERLDAQQTAIGKLAGLGQKLSDLGAELSAQVESVAGGGS